MRLTATKIFDVTSHFWGMTPCSRVTTLVSEELVDSVFGRENPKCYTFLLYACFDLKRSATGDV
jgi:hypothetical protein